MRYWILQYRFQKELIREEFGNWQLMMEKYWFLDSKGFNPVICDLGDK